MGKTVHQLELHYLANLRQYQEVIESAWNDNGLDGSTIPSWFEYESLFENSDMVNPVTIDWVKLKTNERAMFRYLNGAIFVIQEQMIFWRLDREVIFHMVYVFMDAYLQMMIDYRDWRFGNDIIHGRGNGAGYMSHIRKWRVNKDV